MVEQINDGAKNASNDGHKSIDWHHVWKSVEDVGTKAGTSIKSHVAQIDTKDLGDKAKHAAVKGLELARGQSNNSQANEISDTAARYVPGAGLLRKGAEIAHETGADGKFLEGRKGPLRAPRENSLKDVGREAIGIMIPVPGGRILSNEVLNRTGLKDKIIDGAFEAAKNHGATTGSASHERVEQTKNQEQNSMFPPKMVSEDKILHGFHIFNASAEKK